MDEFRNYEKALAALKEAAKAAGKVAEEAARESLRREVLAAEISAWRRALMKRSFVEERLAAAEELRRVKSDQEVALAARLKQLGLLGR